MLFGTITSPCNTVVIGYNIKVLFVAVKIFVPYNSKVTFDDRKFNGYNKVPSFRINLAGGSFFFLILFYFLVNYFG